MTVTTRRLSAANSATAGCAALLLAACQPATETKAPETAPAPSTAPAASPPTPVTFSHDPKLDAVGY